MDVVLYVILVLFLESGSDSCAGQLPVALQLSCALQEDRQREKGEQSKNTEPVANAEEKQERMKDEHKEREGRKRELWNPT